MSSSTRSIAIATIRRQFLMKVHPDRFNDSKIRSNQTRMLKRFNFWCETVGFDDYFSDKSGSHNRITPVAFTDGKNNDDNINKFFIENTEGDFIECSIQWDSVGDVLRSMIGALRITESNFDDHDILSQVEELQQPISSTEQNFTGNIQWAKSTNQPNIESYGVSEKYNRRSNHGRNLGLFLEDLNAEELECRRNLRVDASDAARTVKETYRFEAVDASRLQWSSDNLCKVFTSLNNMHNEHKSKLRIKSFNPLRLVLSSDDHLDRFCEYSSEILINPAATPLQWLRVFMQVEESNLIEAKSKRERLSRWTRAIEDKLPLKIRKGSSCSSSEYYECIHRISGELEKFNLSHISYQSRTALTRSDIVYISFEASGSYRRPQVGKDGILHVGADIDYISFVSTWKRMQNTASKKRLSEEAIISECREKIKLMQSQFEIIFVRKEQRSAVTSEQVLDCLKRLISRIAEEDACGLLHKRLPGNAIRIGASGQLCRMGNDGSIVIPWNWQ